MARDLVYVVSSGSDCVDAFELPDLRQVQHYDVGREPITAVLLPGELLAVATQVSDELVILEVGTGVVRVRVPAERGSSGLAFARSRGLLFVANEFAPSIQVFDATNFQLVRRFVSGKGPCIMTLTPDEGLCLITNEESNTLSVYDITGDQILANIDIPDGPLGVAATTDGRLALCGSFLSSRITLVDLLTRCVIAERRVGSLHVGVAALEDGIHGVVTNSDVDTLTILRLADLQPTRTIKVGAGPAMLCQVPGTDRLLCTNRTDDSVSLVDLREGRELARRPVGLSPMGITIVHDDQRSEPGE